MSSLFEILVTCDSSNPLWTCCIWDHHTGTSLMTHKGGGTAENRTLSFISNEYMAVVEKLKPILHIWPLNSHQTIQGMRFILPGKCSAMAFSSDGAYCVAGIDEKIYLWQLASGKLLTLINRHYQKIINLKFTPDNSHFVSAAEDGMVMVWSLTAVAVHPEVDLVLQKNAGQHDPVYMFSDHSLPVTDMCLSKTSMRGRLCTVSSDRTCKIYDLASGEMLLNLVFDLPLTAVSFDVLELNLFVGSSEGAIYQMSLTHPPRNRDLLANTESSCIFTSHTKAIVSLSCSLDGETLMSSSCDEQVILWHIRSRQPVRTIKHKGPITNAFFATNHPAIYKQDFVPNLTLHSLERTLERDSEDATEIEIITNKKNNFWLSKYKSDLGINETMEDIADVEFKRKEGDLKLELEKLKTINANLYSFSINKALSAEKSKLKNNKH